MLRWLRDWRTGAVILGSVLLAYLGVLVVTSIQDRQAAIDAAKTTTQAAQATADRASRRITQLLTQITALQADAQANGQRIAQLVLEVQLLETQVRDLGGQPVVTTSSGGGRGTSTAVNAHPTPSSRPSSRPTPTSTPTRRPSPTPSPTRTCTVHVGPVCV